MIMCCVVCVFSFITMWLYVFFIVMWMSCVGMSLSKCLLVYPVFLFQALAVFIHCASNFLSLGFGGLYPLCIRFVDVNFW